MPAISERVRSRSKAVVSRKVWTSPIGVSPEAVEPAGAKALAREASRSVTGAVNMRNWASDAVFGPAVT